MTILRNKAYIILAFTFLFAGCKEQQKKNLISKQERPVKKGYTTICFINGLDKEPLNKFRFGRYFNDEELPSKLILDRDSFGLITEPYVDINHEKLNNGDSVFGYFEKNGFKPKKFYINPAINKQIVEIEPNPSEIIIKSIDEEFKNNFDSIKLIITKQIDNQEIIKGSTSNLVREDFVFTPDNLSKDLSIFNYYINSKENLKLRLSVFDTKNNYTLTYEIKYQPFTTTIIKVH